MYRLISGVFMGWALGSNDSANVFGPAVYSGTVRFRTATILVAIFVILGAWLEGRAGMNTLTSLVDQTVRSAFVVSLAAALTVTMMSILRLPVSTSQATVGAILGAGVYVGGFDGAILIKVLIAWVSTPVGTVVVSIVLYSVLGRILDRLPINIFIRDRMIKIATVVVGAYGAYALGANNVANVTGIYTSVGLLTVNAAAIIGGASIALGALTFSRNVMLTVGRSLVRLDPFSAFVVVLSEAIVVHIFARVGVPVSTSQAVVGGILGIGLLKGAQTINARALVNIGIGWLGTPAVGFALAVALFPILA